MQSEMEVTRAVRRARNQCQQLLFFIFLFILYIFQVAFLPNVVTCVTVKYDTLELLRRSFVVHDASVKVI